MFGRSKVDASGAFAGGSLEASKDHQDKTPREPTGDMGFRSHLSVVPIRNLSESIAEDGTFYRVQSRNVQFEESTKRELPESSRISYAAHGSTLPMAQDNDRFFSEEGGYSHRLNEVTRKLEEGSSRKKFWKEPGSEVGFFGWIWRLFLRIFIALTSDHINRLGITRGMQDFLFFLSGYESFVVGGVVRAFDVEDSRLEWYNLRLAFKNRNSSRVLLQQFLARYDKVWHWSTQITWNRIFDMLGQFPIIGVTSFPPTENFPSSKNHALRAMLRELWSGSWLTRSLTSNQEDLVTLDRNTPAQNLAAESNGFEEANRNQFGTYFGRMKTNAFREEHRLPTDESIVRTFMTSPASTLVNNGCEHVLRCLAKHWANMLWQDNGNFAHQRMEQLNPFEILRFHMPIVLLTLSNLRGRNVWDSSVLGPFVKRLQSFDPSKVQRVQQSDAEEGTDLRGGDYGEVYAPCQEAQNLIREMKDTIVEKVCAGISSRMQPLREWLDAICEACDQLRMQAEEVKSLVDSVDKGIKLGYTLLKQVDWRVPSEKEARAAIIAYIRDGSANTSGVANDCIWSALHKMAPKDERTLRELVFQRMEGLEPCKQLLGRARTLLDREIRRKALDSRIRDLSKGRRVTPDLLKKRMWYWVKNGRVYRVYVFLRMTGNGSHLKLIDIDTNVPAVFSATSVELREYLPLAEAISRAQKAFMVLELDHGKRFSYNAFMEFGSVTSSSSLRTRLRRLAILSQVHCSELDKARLNVLAETKNSVTDPVEGSQAMRRRFAQYEPQSTVVIGAGPTGLMTAIHCAQNVILSGGEIFLYQDRDAFEKEASAFERAQIVRLDARWIAMLRYHLGTSYEDVFVPAENETDPHLGNVLPSQGFVEVTIKRLENMLNDEAVALRSRELIHFYAGSKIEYDSVTGTFRKDGRSLKENESIFLEGDPRPWKVKGFEYETRVQRGEDLVQGEYYDIVPPFERTVRHFRLEAMDVEMDWFHFTAQDVDVKDLVGSFAQIPPVYANGRGRVDPTSIVLEHAKRGTGGEHERVSISYDAVSEQSFDLDLTRAHVLIAAGKPKESTEHFTATTPEPYAVCCIEGLKISRGMHNFGEPRWKNGLIDDSRSFTDQNTRVIGDFTKSVALKPTVQLMLDKVGSDDVWKYHFENLPESVADRMSGLQGKLLDELGKLAKLQFRRSRLQTRFFELGDNYYLGMELAREFAAWKTEVVPKLVPGLPTTAPPDAKEKRRRLRSALLGAIDRLWYEATLQIISSGDVYNPGGRSSIPRLYTIDCPFEQELGELELHQGFALANTTWRVTGKDGGAFSLVQCGDERVEIKLPSKVCVKVPPSKKTKLLGNLDDGTRFQPVDMFEVLVKGSGQSIVRTSRGYVGQLKNSIRVRRLSDLSRGPDGYSESKVALASFPVAHVVCHRTLNVKRTDQKRRQEGHITAFLGDAQASPHFMRYSGLTGACINSMSFNNLVAQAVNGTPFIDRIQRYSFETNWSNGEVVQRGTGANYGRDGFLRPGFKYRELVDYLFARAVEHVELEASLDNILTRDWKTKVAASLVPRGLENDALFRAALFRQLRQAVQEKFSNEVLKATKLEELPEEITAVVSEHAERLWYATPAADSDQSHAISSSYTEEHQHVVEETVYAMKGVVEALEQAFDHSLELRSHNRRISSELSNQPKPVDSLIDDFAVEAQNFANSLTQSTAFAAGAIALSLISETYANAVSATLGVLNIAISFGTMTNVSRYKNRNEEYRCVFSETKLLKVMKGVFSLMTRDQRERFVIQENPFVSHLDDLVARFLEDARYYDFSAVKIASFEEAYEDLRRSINGQQKTIIFMRSLVQEFIPITFHVNSYLQEELVEIYKVLHEMLLLSRQAASGTVAGSEALYRKLLDFKPKLEESIEEGDIRFGFLKDRPWREQALPVTVRYLLSPLLSLFFGSVQDSTREVLKKAEHVQSSSGKADTLRREIRDLKELHSATQESQVASMVFLSALIVFITSILFTIFRFIGFAGDEERNWIAFLVGATSWAAVGSLLGALLALFHFARKIRHLFTLVRTLPFMAKENSSLVRRIRAVTWTQIFLTLMRLIAVSAACIGLPWSVAAQTWGSQISLSEDIPVWISAGAAFTAIGAMVFFFIVEFLIRYNLDPCLGRVVCAPFRQELETIKASFDSTRTVAQIETEQYLESEAWEYTAREFLHKFRFDTVFAADRFGSIVQQVQSGAEVEDRVSS